METKPAYFLVGSFVLILMATLFAFTLWLAERPALGIATAAAAWIGVRASTWFLFGQYGAAPVTALIWRRPLTSEPRPAVGRPIEDDAWWEAPLQAFKNEADWLHGKSDRLLEYLALPVLHVLAATVNFGLVLVASRPVFQLPFHHLEEIPETRAILTDLHLQPRKP